MEARAPSDLRVLLGGLRVQPQRHARRVPFVSKDNPLALEVAERPVR